MTPRPKPHQRIVGDERDGLAAELVEKYQAGAAIRALADEYQRSYGFVHQVLSDAGVELRKRGGATRKPRVLTEQQEREYADRLAGYKIRRR